MPLKYHQSTIDLITQSPFLQAEDLPELSPINSALLDEKERLYNVQFPASIREWFTLNLPSEISHYEHGTPHTQDLKPLSEVIDPDIPQTSTDLWFFFVAEYNQQGGDDIFFKINGSGDPPIYIDIEENWDNRRKYGPKFIKINDRFSSFIYNHFWDYHRRESYKYFLRLSNFPVFELPHKYYVPFNKLRQRFNELSDNLVSRFYNDQVCIWAYKPTFSNDKDSVSNEVMHHGYIMVNDIEKLKEVIHDLWEDDIPTRNIYGQETEVTELLNTFKLKDKK